MESSRSAGTRRAYASGWRRFTDWCARNGHVPLPAHPVTVAAYLVDAADTVTAAGERAYAASTLSAWASAINHFHQTTGKTSPTGHHLVAAALAGIRRQYATAGDRPRTQRAPLLVSDIRHLVDTARGQCDGWADDVYERRDSALLLLGFAGAFRRSELADLECRDVSLHREDGCTLASVGPRPIRKVAASFELFRRPNRTPRARPARMCGGCRLWQPSPPVGPLPSSGCSATGTRSTIICAAGECPAPRRGHRCSGPLPKTATSAPRTFPVPPSKRPSDAAPNARATTLLWSRSGGHFLRAGFVTQASRNGADAHAIMRQTGHTTPAMLERYARQNAPLMGNAVVDNVL